MIPDLSFSLWAFVLVFGGGGLLLASLGGAVGALVSYGLEGVWRWAGILLGAALVIPLFVLLHWNTLIEPTLTFLISVAAAGITGGVAAWSTWLIARAIKRNPER